MVLHLMDGCAGSVAGSLLLANGGGMRSSQNIARIAAKYSLHAAPVRPFRETYRASLQRSRQ